MLVCLVEVLIADNKKRLHNFVYIVIYVHDSHTMHHLYHDQIIYKYSAILHLLVSLTSFCTVKSLSINTSFLP